MDEVHLVDFVYYNYDYILNRYYEYYEIHLQEHSPHQLVIDYIQLKDIKCDHYQVDVFQNKIFLEYHHDKNPYLI